MNAKIIFLSGACLFGAQIYTMHKDEKATIATSVQTQQEDRIRKETEYWKQQLESMHSYLAKKRAEARKQALTTTDLRKSDG